NTARSFGTQVSRMWRRPSQSTAGKRRRDLWRSKTWLEGRSPSPTEACSDLSWARPSSTPPNPPSSACTPPRCGLSSDPT
ncbi:unnamed protein product, partial [Ectocarpus sp. 13 AM-2016]